MDDDNNTELDIWGKYYELEPSTIHWLKKNQFKHIADICLLLHTDKRDDYMDKICECLPIGEKLRLEHSLDNINGYIIKSWNHDFYSVLSNYFKIKENDKPLEIKENDKPLEIKEKKKSKPLWKMIYKGFNKALCMAVISIIWYNIFCFLIK